MTHRTAPTPEQKARTARPPAASTSRARALATRQVHAGYTPGVPQNTVAVPVYQSVAYEFADFATARDTFALRRPGNI